MGSLKVHIYLGKWHIRLAGQLINKLIGTRSAKEGKAALKVGELFS
jgi:hypothetical protein